MSDGVNKTQYGSRTASADLDALNAFADRLARNLNAWGGGFAEVMRDDQTAIFGVQYRRVPFSITVSITQ